MSAVFSPERRPAGLLGPGLLMVVLASVTLSCLQAAYGEVTEGFDPRGAGLSGPTLFVLAGVFGAFGGFIAVLIQATLVWIYGKAWQPVSAGFVRTLAVVALAVGVTLLLQLLVFSLELLATGEMPLTPATNLARHLGEGSVNFDLLSLVTVAAVYLGARRYLGYGAWAAGILVLAMLVINLASGMLI